MSKGLRHLLKSASEKIRSEDLDWLAAQCQLIIESKEDDSVVVVKLDSERLKIVTVTAFSAFAEIMANLQIDKQFE